jgi:hypothetical protein
VTGPSKETGCEDNDLHRGHGEVCEGDSARVGVSHGVVEVKLMLF